jgi:hypothetical protein
MTTETNAVTNTEKAREIIAGTTAYAMEEVKGLLDKLDHEKAKHALAKESATKATSRYINLFTSIEEFIKEHVKEEQVQIDNLKDFAKEIGLELTKTIKVTFIAECEYEFTVPIDFDNDDITEDDFSIRISSMLSGDDVEETHESMEVKDFEVEDND